MNQKLKLVIGETIFFGFHLEFLDLYFDLIRYCPVAGCDDLYKPESAAKTPYSLGSDEAEFWIQRVETKSSAVERLRRNVMNSPNLKGFIVAVDPFLDVSNWTFAIKRFDMVSFRLNAARLGCGVVFPLSMVVALSPDFNPGGLNALRAARDRVKALESVEFTSLKKAVPFLTHEFETPTGTIRTDRALDLNKAGELTNSIIMHAFGYPKTEENGRHYCQSWLKSEIPCAMLEPVIKEFVPLFGQCAPRVPKCDLLLSVNPGVPQSGRIRFLLAGNALAKVCKRQKIEIRRHHPIWLRYRYGSYEPTDQKINFMIRREWGVKGWKREEDECGSEKRFVGRLVVDLKLRKTASRADDLILKFDGLVFHSLSKFKQFWASADPDFAESFFGPARTPARPKSGRSPKPASGL